MAGIGAGRTNEEGTRDLPSLKLEYRWADPDLREAVGDDRFAAAEDAASRPNEYHSQSSYMPSTTSITSTLCPAAGGSDMH